MFVLVINMADVPNRLELERDSIHNYLRLIGKYKRKHRRYNIVRLRKLETYFRERERESEMRDVLRHKHVKPMTPWNIIRWVAIQQILLLFAPIAGICIHNGIHNCAQHTTMTI